jgi:hypothetical protein
MAAWFAAALAVYLANGPNSGSGDTRPAALIPVAILLDGTVMLDRFGAEERQLPYHYWIVDTARGAASLFPIGAGIVALPIMAGPILWERWRHPSATTAEWRALAIDHWQKWAAAIIAATSVAVFRYAAWALKFGPALSIALTALFAFGSENAAGSSQALWQHGPGTLTILGGVACLAAGGRRHPRVAALLLGACLGMAVAIRPTNLVLAAPLLVVAAWGRPAAIPLVSLAAMATLLPIVSYNLTVWGSLFGGYGTLLSNLQPGQTLATLPAVLLSPGRGLFFYFPAAVLLIGLLVAQPGLLREDLVAALTLGSAALVLIAAAWRFYWGGWCFGPRFLSELQGPVLLVIGMAFPRQPAGRAVAAAALGLSLAISLPIQAVGLFSWATRSWNAVPSNIDTHLDRLWDLGDSPVARGLKANLP